MFRILLFLGLSGLLWGQGGQISGIITDGENSTPLAGANLEIRGTRLGTVSDERGAFTLSGLAEGAYTLRISYLGYRTAERRFRIADGQAVQLDVVLETAPLAGREVVVVTRARKGETPAAFSTLSREDLAVRHYAQDIPIMLSELPSITAYSEGGNGIGYTYLSLRGFDQRRIAIMINGIPQNDPEDHNVYWIDFPDFLDNVEDIQVQRGAGSAFYGPPAIGGSINIVTANFSPQRQISAYSGIGSYGTQKYALRYNSGLIGNNMVVSARVSRVKSDSYRDWARVDFKSYFLGAAHFGERSTTKLHFYGGPIEDQLAYLGLTKAAALDRDTRRGNDISGDRQIENFNQPHLELINQYQLSEKVLLNNTLFGIRGNGFFDYDGSWAPFSYFRLTPEFGFDVSGDPDGQYASDVLIRAHVDNKQLGWLPHLSWQHANGTLILGSEVRLHRSLHWGRIQEGSNDLPAAVSGEYGGRSYIGERRYYEYKGGKDVVAPYFQNSFRVRRNVDVHLGLQYVLQRYRIYDEAFIDNDFTVNFNFLNPRLGVNVTLSPQASAFASFSRTAREPRLKNYYDAAEASTPAVWGAVVPQFQQDTNGQFNFDDPLVSPEKLNDFELGFSYQGRRIRGDINLFYMQFADEIVKSGQLDRFGQPVTGNADRSFHSGIEVSTAMQLTTALSAIGNITVSRNELSRYSLFDYDDNGAVVEIRLDGNPIAGFPDMLANLRLQYQRGPLTVSTAMQHVGKQYTDNFANEDNTVDAYTVFNGMLGYDLGAWLPVRGFSLQLHLQNIFDTIYITHGEGADNFFPAAERHLFVNARIEM